MAEQKDTTSSTTNPQAQRPGTVEPERTPGSAPSVVPLPAGADPSRPGEHPLPEEAIDGYPAVAATENDKAPDGPGSIGVPADSESGGDGEAKSKPADAPAKTTASTGSASKSGQKA